MNNNRSLRLFDVPLELLDQLEPIEKTPEVVLAEQATQVTADALERLQLQQEDVELTCRTCQLTFASRAEQRSHYNTDWHRYNIKRKLVLDTTPVSFEEFEKILSDLTESISGSEDEEEDDDDEQDKINAIVSKQKQEQNEQEENSELGQPIIASELKKYSALSWFRHKQNISLHYGVYRNLLSSSSLAELRKKENKRYWTILMLGGGHFAACVIDVNASVSDVKFVEHKTIHRYTTRRKQGGAQSANDNARGKANSAGAQIRRYNEQLLQQEVRQTIAQWKGRIQSSEFVFVHAPSGNRNVIFGYDGAILKANETKSIPFVTRRPTLNELKRVCVELTTVKVVEVDKQAIEEQQKAEEEERLRKQQTSVKKIQQKEVVTQPKRTLVDPKIEKLLGLVRQKKTAATLTYIQKHINLPISGLLPKELVNEDLRHYPTLLHMAAALGGSGDLVLELLSNYDADPTIISDAGKTAYEVSKDKETRNAFRRCMYDLPNKWKWLDEGRVPSPLTKEQEQEQLKKEKKKLQREEEKRKLLDLEKAKQDMEREAKEQQLKQQKQNLAKKDKGKFASVQRTLGSVSNTPSDIANMSPEARMRLEREKRAKAAEERMKRLAPK